MFFNSMVRPILFYGCEVWGMSKADPIEVFYREFLKYVLRVKTSTPNIYVYGELGVYPLWIDRQIRVLKYWAKIINPESSKGEFVKNIYREMYELSLTNPQVVTWATTVRDTLKRLDLGIYWENQTISDDDFFLSLVRRKLQNSYLTKWTSDVIDSTDGRLFRCIKTAFRYESYLDNIQNKALRYALTRIRLSSHRYKIETGRWGRNKVPREERKCDICNVIEDEFHVLVSCPRFVNERNNLLPQCLLQNPNIDVFERVFDTSDVHVQTQLALLCLNVERAYLNFV